MAYVRNNKGEMVPVSTLVTASKVSAPEFTNRFNLYRSAEINGIPAPGYSSSQALKALEETAKEVLASDNGLCMVKHVFPGESRQKALQVPIFIMALLFVFLILAAQYESWKLPFSVLLGIPLSLFSEHFWDYSLPD